MEARRSGQERGEDCYISLPLTCSLSLFPSTALILLLLPLTPYEIILSEMEVAVVGGGVGGLVAGRHVCEPSSGLRLCLYEQADQLGGTWVYSELRGKDRSGLPVHSSMYKGLRTNLPKETMMFPDFPHPHHTPSYLTSKEVLHYLNEYADHFNIRPYVKLRHHVKEISPWGDKWKMTVVDLNQRKQFDQLFDAVIVCNGHNSTPRYPKIEGIRYFKGKTMHSHDYRDSEEFRGRRVLVIGAGPSGLDITFALAKVTNNVILSHHTEYGSKVEFPEQVITKPDIERIVEDGSIIFKDGSRAEVDDIMYCTGYLYTYPFLAKECGVTVEENYVSPLFKSVININRPTMGFIAVVKHTPTFYVADLQVRFFLQSLKHPQGLPTKEEMMADLDDEINEKIKRGVKKSNYHIIGDDNSGYLRQISQLGGFQTIPPILLKIYFHGYNKIFSDFKNFRNNYYRIIDKDNFSVVDTREIHAQHIERIPSDLSCMNLIHPRK